jgi:hypothetical protein
MWPWISGPTTRPFETAFRGSSTSAWRRRRRAGLFRQLSTDPGLPDFYWCVIPKREKCSKWTQNFPDHHKIHQRFPINQGLPKFNKIRIFGLKKSGNPALISPLFQSLPVHTKTVWNILVYITDSTNLGLGRVLRMFLSNLFLENCLKGNDAYLLTRHLLQNLFSLRI